MAATNITKKNSLTNKLSVSKSSVKQTTDDFDAS